MVYSFREVSVPRAKSFGDDITYLGCTFLIDIEEIRPRRHFLDKWNDKLLDSRLDTSKSKAWQPSHYQVGSFY